jgi:branched-subunit amino acid transport protein
VKFWLIMLAAGLATFGIRLSFIVLIGQREIPPQVSRFLRFVPPAVLSAIIFPEVLIRDGAFELSLGNPRLLAALASALVAWKTKNIVLTIAAGMAVLALTVSLFP